MKEIIKKQIEIESYETGKLKVDMNIFKKKSNAKTPCNLILVHSQKCMKENNLEMGIYLQELYRQAKQLETSEKVILSSWKGKSSINIIKKPNSFIVITYQKFSQDCKPREVRREIIKSEVNDIIKIINYFNGKSNGKRIPTRDIGEMYYKKIWDKIFANRYEHTQLNLILRLLDYYGLIFYRGGYTQVLKNKIDFQEIL